MRARLAATFDRPLNLPAYALFVLAALPAISFAAHFRGEMVFGWDSLPPLRPAIAVHDALSAWSWNADLGQTNVFGMLVDLPVDALYRLLAAPFGIALAQKIVLTALYVLPAFTMYAYARRVFPHVRTLAFLAGWCYALCPLLFVRYYIPILPVQLVYGTLPLLVNVWIDLLRRGADARRLLALAAVEAATWPATGNVAYWLVLQLAALAFALVVAAAQSRGRWARDRERIAAGVAVVVLVNLFWFVPQALLGVREGTSFERESVTKAYSAGIRKDVARNANLSYALRLTSRAQTTAGDANGTYWTDSALFRNPAFAAATFAWIALAACALGLRPHDRRTVALGILLVTALFVMKGESAPFAAVLTLAYRIPIAGTIFRDGFDKLLPMAAFALALLVPIAVLGIGPRRWVGARQLALTLAVLAMAAQFWTGQMFMARPNGPTLAAMPPPDAFAIGRALDAVRSRVLVLPGSDNPALTATTWRYYGPDPYAEISGAPLVPYAASAKNRPATDAVTTALYRAVADGNVAAFRTLARDTGYRVQAFRATGAARTVPLRGADPHGDALHLPISRLSPGFNAIAVRAAADRSNVVAEIADAGTGRIVAARRGLYTGTNVLTFYALPGRDYRLDVSGEVTFGRARDDVAAVRATPLSRSALATIAAPRAATPCPRLVDERADAVRAGRLDAAFAVEQRALLVRAYGMEAPFDVFTVPLPRGTTLVRDGDDAVSTAAVDESVTPGFTTVLHGYRSGGPPAIVPIANLQSSGPMLVSDLDAARGRITLQTNLANQWVRIDVPPAPARDYTVNVAASGLIGYYGAAIADSNFTVVASKRGVRAAKNQRDASLRIASISMQPIVPTGVASFTLPRAMPAVATTPGAVLVAGGVAGRGAPLARGYVAPENVPTALVLETQFDPFWKAIVLQPHVPFVWMPPHTIAGGYANAWIVPPGAGGVVVSFYALTAYGYALFALALATFAVLVYRARRGAAR